MDELANCTQAPKYYKWKDGINETKKTKEDPTIGSFKFKIYLHQLFLSILLRNYLRMRWEIYTNTKMLLSCSFFYGYEQKEIMKGR